MSDSSVAFLGEHGDLLGTSVAEKQRPRIRMHAALAINKGIFIGKIGSAVTQQFGNERRFS